MQQPPNYPNYGGWPQQPQQPNTQYPPQQPPWQPQPPPPNTYYPPPPWQQPPMMPPPLPPRPPGKKANPWLILGIIAAVIIFGGIIANAAQSTTPQSNTTVNTADTPTDTPAPTATDTPSPTPTPTVDPAQIEELYKTTTKSTTVDNLDKDGNADKGKDVHFTCKILRFVKDDSGNTAGANVESPNSYSMSVVQVVFPSGTDITRLNEGDLLEIWGTDEGVFSGKNAFGGDVQEVGIGALYITDTTTNYQTS